jgi:hypothetical protein
MFKDVMARLAVAVKEESGRQKGDHGKANARGAQSLFVADRASALRLARSVVPTLEGTEAVKAADAVMVSVCAVGLLVLPFD